MIDVHELARRLGVLGRPQTTRARGRARVTADHVLACLRRGAEAPLLAPRDRQAIDRALATLPSLVVEERLDRRHRGFARYFESLPRIAFLYGRGYMPEEIAEQMRFMASDYGVEAVLRLVAERVAARVNRA